MRKLLLSTLFVFSAIVTLAADVVTKEGAWCWFADPRAIHFADAEAGIDASYIGYIDVHGNVKATQIDWKTISAQRFWCAAISSQTITTTQLSLFFQINV